MQKYFDGFASPIGRLHVVVSDKAVLHIYFSRETWKEKFVRDAMHPLIMRTKKELAEYFLGKRKRFTIPLAPEGTAFQKAAWNVLRKIPYGKTISYGEEARRTRNPFAVRAIGSANGKNPLPILIPCHRVVTASGKLGGYSGGLKWKEKLLKLEERYF